MNFSTREIVLAGVFAAPGLLCRHCIPFRTAGSGALQSLTHGFSAGGRSLTTASGCSQYARLCSAWAGRTAGSGCSPFGGVIYIFKPTSDLYWAMRRSLDGVHGHPQAGTQFPIYLAACTAGIIVLYLIGLPYLYIILDSTSDKL